MAPQLGRSSRKAGKPTQARLAARTQAQWQGSRHSQPTTSTGKQNKAGQVPNASGLSSKVQGCLLNLHWQIVATGTKRSVPNKPATAVLLSVNSAPRLQGALVVGSALNQTGVHLQEMATACARVCVVWAGAGGGGGRAAIVVQAGLGCGGPWCVAATACFPCAAAGWQIKTGWPAAMCCICWIHGGMLDVSDPRWQLTAACNRHFAPALHTAWQQAGQACHHTKWQCCLEAL